MLGAHARGPTWSVGGSPRQYKEAGRSEAGGRGWGGAKKGGVGAEKGGGEVEKRVSTRWWTLGGGEGFAFAGVRTERVVNA